VIVVNKLTAPGGIRRIDIHWDTVKVVTQDGKDIVYRKEALK